jgi:hypothetical protein
MSVGGYKMTNKTFIISIIGLGLLSAIPCWTVPQIIYEVKAVGEAMEQNLGEPHRDTLINEDKAPWEEESLHGGLAELIDTNLMLNWVINCESSNRHEGIWGKAGEYGILQFKPETFDYLSEKYNFTGDWQNQDDQIELFLLTSEQDKMEHWTCYKKYEQWTP